MIKGQTAWADPENAYEKLAVNHRGFRCSGLPYLAVLRRRQRIEQTNQRQPLPNPRPLRLSPRQPKLRTMAALMTSMRSATATSAAPEAWATGTAWSADRLGKQVSMQVETQSKIINDPVVSEYINRLGQNMVRNSDSQVPFTIKVIDSDDINAFAFPAASST